MELSRKSASTWLFIPRDGVSVEERKEGIVLRANQSFLFVQLLGERHEWISPPDSILNSLPDKDPMLIFRQYKVLASVGKASGFVIQAAEASDFSSIEAFVMHMIRKTRLDLSGWPVSGKVRYTSLQGDLLEMQYEPLDLRCSGRINGRPLDYGNWANGAVYQSPYVSVKDGIMHFTDGIDSYLVNCRGERPLFTAVGTKHKQASDGE
jgi:hypothetical protein